MKLASAELGAKKKVEEALVLLLVSLDSREGVEARSIAKAVETVHLSALVNLFLGGGQLHTDPCGESQNSKEWKHGSNFVKTDDDENEGRKES